MCNAGRGIPQEYCSIVKKIKYFVAFSFHFTIGSYVVLAYDIKSQRNTMKFAVHIISFFTVSGMVSAFAVIVNMSDRPVQMTQQTAVGAKWHPMCAIPGMYWQVSSSLSWTNWDQVSLSQQQRTCTCTRTHMKVWFSSIRSTSSFRQRSGGQG